MSLASVLLALAIAAPAQPQPHIDAITADESLAMMAVEEGIVEAYRKHCGREVAASKRSFDSHAWQWRTQNQLGLNAVASFASTQYRDKYQTSLSIWIESGFEAIESRSRQQGADAVCADFLAELKSGKRSIANRTPKAWQLLMTYLAGHPLRERDAHPRAMTHSCIEQRFSRGADFDLASSICHCVTDVIYGELSEVELSEYRRVAAAGQYVSALPFMTALRPKLLACLVGK